MDSGKEYLLKEHPEDVFRRIFDENKGIIKTGFLHEIGVSISTDHISSLESVTVKE